MIFDGIEVVVQPILAPDAVYMINGRLVAGSLAAVHAVVEALNARPWWQKILDECHAYDVAQARVAAVLRMYEEAKREIDQMPRYPLSPYYLESI